MQIQFDGVDFAQNSSGSWLMLKVSDLRTATSAIGEIENGKMYVADIKQHRKRRSLDANAYAWVMIGKLAEKTGIGREKIYRSLIREIGGNSDTICVQNRAVDRLCESWHANGLGWVTDTLESKIDGCTNVILYYGSSTYDRAQMSRLIDLLVQECKQQGIETQTPAQLAVLMEAYSEKHTGRK